jgi:hypothetical protein
LVELVFNDPYAFGASRSIISQRSWMVLRRDMLKRRLPVKVFSVASLLQEV